VANIFTDAGEAFIVDLVDGTITKPTNYFIGWGTGAGTAAKADTTLFTEAAETRATATLTQPSAEVNQFAGTITVASAGKTITNAGVLTLVTGGTLILKSDFTGLALNVGDSIVFTFQLTWS
jgi:hypothetical protein